MKLIIACVVIVSLTSGCAFGLEPARLVPPTVDEDPRLPSVSITVAEQTRLIHYRTFGDHDNPVLLVAHGSLSDLRAYLPFQTFADEYYVVLWDMRGNGLSERVSADELAVDRMAEEFHAVKHVFSPNRDVTVCGHSWSAVFAARYLAEYPDEVEQAILIEPPGLSDREIQESGAALNLFTSEYMDLVYATSYMSPRDHEELDYQVSGMLHSAVRDFYCDSNDLPPWPYWRVGGFALLTWEDAILDGFRFSYDFTVGLESFSGEVLLVGSSCSPIGYDFQETYHAPLFQDARVLTIENSGHRMITEQWAAFEAGLRDFLAEYGG
jgi:proline iminopeptidase